MPQSYSFSSAPQTGEPNEHSCKRKGPEEDKKKWTMILPYADADN